MNAATCVTHTQACPAEALAVAIWDPCQGSPLSWLWLGRAAHAFLWCPRDKDMAWGTEDEEAHCHKALALVGNRGQDCKGLEVVEHPLSLLPRNPQPREPQ